MTDKKKTEELNEAELDQVTGGLGHELSHSIQQRGGKIIDYQDGHDLLAKGKSKPGVKGVVASGGSNGI